MATKTAKKPTSTKRATSSAAKKTTKLSAKDLLLVKKSERHYVIFYIIFAITTIIFAALTVVFFTYASDLETKYDELRNCLSSDKNCPVYVKKAEEKTDQTNYYTDETVVNNAEEAAQ